MTKPKIYFSHGKDSKPNGFKISYLQSIAKNLDFDYESIDYTSTKNPDERVKILLSNINKNEDVIFYGSSMGAYVSLVASKIIKPKALFLCAPALYLPNYEIQEFANLEIPITIIHGKNDTMVSYKNSIQFAEKQNCEFHIVNDNHSLENSQSIISFLFEKFLSKTINPYYSCD